MKMFSLGYTPYTANLFWDKPTLCSVVARDAEGSPVYVKRYLEGYRLYINAKLHMQLDNSAQSVTLTKCKPGKSYDVSLVALTLPSVSPGNPMMSAWWP